jgi:hypothetical protein
MLNRIDKNVRKKGFKNKFMNRPIRKRKQIKLLGVILLGFLISFFQSNLNDAFSFSGEINNKNNPADSVEFKSYSSETTANLATTNMNVLGERLWFAGAETGNLSEWSGNPIMNSQNVLFSGSSSDRAKSGSRSFKLQVDAGGKMASTQLYRWGKNGEPNTNNDLIFTTWYYFNEKVDFFNVSFHNIMQWKVRTESTRSHPVLTLGFGVQGGRGSGGDNFIQLRNTGEWFPNSSSFNYTPLQNLKVPVKQWFKLQVRYIHGSNKNGRIMVWQGDLSGNDILLYDIQNVTTYPAVDRNGSRTVEIQWSVNNYTQNTIPSVTTIYVDDASIHKPGETQAIPTYSLTLQRNPSSGGIIENLTLGNTFKQGDQVKLKASPNSGFAFLNWSRNGQVISTNPEYTFTMPGSNVTLVANFETVSAETTKSLQVGAFPSTGGKVRIKSN